MSAPSRLLGCLSLLICTVTSNVGEGWAEERFHPACSCALASRGWLLFQDSTPGTPDFWWQSEIVVQEITICAHGIEFRFMAQEQGNPYLVALVFTTPPLRLGRRNELPVEQRRLDALQTKVRGLMGGALDEFGTMDFHHAISEERPRIREPWRRLILIWRDQEVELRGYLDVYMTMLL